MKTTENQTSLLFEGAGYFLGALISLVLGISLFVLTENFTIALSSSVPIGVTLGILMEQRFQKKTASSNPKSIKLLTGLLILGILVFFAILFL